MLAYACALPQSTGSLSSSCDGPSRFKRRFIVVWSCLQGTGRPGVPLYRSLRSFWRDLQHNRLLAVPAFLYAINNYLKFAIQLFFRPTSAKMLTNLKIFVIALLMRFVLKRRFSTLQWEALFLLVAGITVNQLHNCSATSTLAAGSSLLSALICTSLSCTVPAGADTRCPAAAEITLAEPCGLLSRNQQDYCCTVLAYMLPVLLQASLRIDTGKLRYPSD